eukprot:3873578-Amphidinium_carterae.2
MPDGSIIQVQCFSSFESEDSVLCNVTLLIRCNLGFKLGSEVPRVQCIYSMEKILERLVLQYHNSHAYTCRIIVQRFLLEVLLISATGHVSQRSIHERSSVQQVCTLPSVQYAQTHDIEAIAINCLGVNPRRKTIPQQKLPAAL